MNKKVLAVFLTLALCVSLLSGLSFAAEDAENAEVQVNVTIANAGELVLVNQSVAVTDVDEDGTLTVFDVLAIAHSEYYEAANAAEEADGEEETESADYGFAVSDEGFITKLWGVENGGSYGYYLNHAAAMSITDPVADGDYLAAFAYADLEAWSDMYTYFENTTVSCEPEAELELKLSGAGYDDSWNPVVLAVSGAKILVNGEETAFVTDENGAVTVTFAEEGTYIVSASSDELTLVPPVCVVTAAKKDAEEPDDAEDGEEGETGGESSETPEFVDIAGHWGEVAAKYVAEKGYMKGISDTEFAPDMELDRASIVTVLYRMEGEPEVRVENPFADVPADTWYTNAILWAAENELVLGYEGRFRPTAALTRSEAAVILYRWAQFRGCELAEAADLSKYDDAAAVEDWAAEAMAWACGEGMITGTSESTISPQQSLTRAQLALMLMRFLED